MSTDMTTTQPAAGSIARSSFNEHSIEHAADTAAVAVAARARAMVEARCVMAMRYPRNIDQVRMELLREVERPGFAQAAWYRKPVGKGVEGPSIRFAESVARAWKNLDIQVSTIHDSPELRIIEVSILDLESNLNFPVSITMSKTVERRQLRDGQTALRMRTNSQGQVTYIVEATDDELLVKQAALVSKAMRTGILRLLPGDIMAECRDRIQAIRHGDAAKDPEGARRRVVDAFAGLNISPADLTEYLGHDLAKATPATIADLRSLWAELSSGETTWGQVMGEVRAERGDKPKGEEKPSTLAAVTESLKSKAADKAAPKSEPVPDPKPERDADGDVVPTLEDLTGGKPEGKRKPARDRLEG